MKLGQDFDRQLVLNKYLILGEFSEGSLGSIYIGRAERGSGDPVFVKSISPLHLKSDEAVELFESEVKKLENIKHPNLAAIIDHGGESGSQLVVSEYVAGFDLGHWSSFVREARGKLPVGIAVRVALEMLGGLGALHDATGSDGESLGVVHRDVKPSNVVIDRSGKVRVTDFGISRIVSEGTAVVDPSVADKLAYLTPELVSKNEPTPASDVYGTALVLYEILTGKNPFIGDNLGMIITAVLMKEPPPANSLRDDIPAELNDAIARALAKKPEDRYPSAAAFAEVLSPLAADAEELAAMVAKDFVDPEMLAMKPIPSLEKRDELLASAPGIKPKKPRPKPPTRLPTEQGARQRAEAAGEVVARRQGEVVWKEKPSTVISAGDRGKKKKKKHKTPPALIAGVALAFVAVAVVLALLLK